MIVKNCAGGLVFWKDKVFLLKNEKGEWFFPKGVIQKDELPAEAVVRIAKKTAGIIAEIISTEGHVSYEISSETRQNPIYNKIIWYAMISKNNEYQVKEEKGYKDGGYYTIEEAMELLTHNNNKAILNFLSRRLPATVTMYDDLSSNVSSSISSNVSSNVSDSTSSNLSDKIKIYRNAELWGYQ